MPDRLTLEEAKAVIQALKAETSFVSAEEAQGYRVAIGRVDAILNCVKTEPDEEGQAVLWLMKKGWTLRFDGEDWIQYRYDSFLEVNPIEEAKKLGWGGGE